MTNVDNLGSKLAEHMMHGAAEALRGQNVTPDLLDRVIAALKAGGAAATDEAMNDAKRALDANMPGYATALAQTTMRLHGIRITKAVLGAA